MCCVFIARSSNGDSIKQVSEVYLCAVVLLYVVCGCAYMCVYIYIHGSTSLIVYIAGAEV